MPKFKFKNMFGILILKISTNILSVSKRDTSDKFLNKITPLPIDSKCGKINVIDDVQIIKFFISILVKPN